MAIRQFLLTTNEENKAQQTQNKPEQTIQTIKTRRDDMTTTLVAHLHTHTPPADAVLALLITSAQKGPAKAMS